MALKKSAKNVNRANFLQKLTISGYKSITKPTAIALGGLTVLAGVNSGGKSSLIQPLLLLKQTLEATHDPGPLKIDGPNVRFSELEQFFSKSKKKVLGLLSFDLEFEAQKEGFTFSAEKRVLKLENNRIEANGVALVLSGESSTAAELLRILPIVLKQFLKGLKSEVDFDDTQIGLEQKRFIFTPRLLSGPVTDKPVPAELRLMLSMLEDRVDKLSVKWVRNLIHVPGLRGVPARGYPVSGVGDSFSGRFDDYTASVIKHWQDDGDVRVGKVGAALEALGLTWKVSAENIDAATVDIKIGRLPKSTRGGARDLVSIADVGFGVSQVMPVVVSLFAARSGQAVYIEQPEIHLHPRAQMALAGLLVDAANRDVQVIVETHSALLLTSLQTLIAQQKIAAADVKLHWVSRDANGSSVVTTAELDADGAYGDWPVDFDETADAATTNYLNATVFKATASK